MKRFAFLVIFCVMLIGRTAVSNAGDNFAPFVPLYLAYAVDDDGGHLATKDFHKVSLGDILLRWGILEIVVSFPFAVLYGVTWRYERKRKKRDMIDHLISFGNEDLLWAIPRGWLAITACLLAGLIMYLVYYFFVA